MPTSRRDKRLILLVLMFAPAIAAADRASSEARQQEATDRVLQRVNALPPSAAGRRISAPPSERSLRPPRQIFDYQPPNLGAPIQRVGGGTRSISQLESLAPRHVALTTQTQPRLYWFVTPGFRNNVRFRLGEIGVKPPLLEIQLKPQPNGGVNFLDLAMHDLRLEPGKVYEWAVILEPFPHQRVPPMVSLGRIAIDEPHPALERASVELKPYAAARHGYWYDAIDWISRQIESNGDNIDLYHQRADLLEQGELLTTALYEREVRGPKR